MEEKTEIREIKATTPKFFRLAASALFDGLTVLLLAFLLCLMSFPIYFSTPCYKEPSAFREEIMLNSRLYERHDGGVSLISYSLKDSASLTLGQKRERASEALSYCYTVYLDEELEGKGRQKLNSYCLAFTYQGENLFGEDGARLLEEEAYEGVYFDAYCEIAEGHGVSDLNLKQGFSAARAKILWGYLISFLIAFSFSCLLLLLLIPLCLKKGKRTLGMLLTKLAYLDQKGLSPSPGRWVLRFLFEWILILCGAFFTFGATLAFSCAFSAWRKDHQCVSDYVLALYPVDASSSEIYASEEELLKSE